MFRLATIAFVLASTTAEAAPVYLTCQLTSGASAGHARTDRMELTLNENAGTVTVSIPAFNLSNTVRGAFSAEKVTFKNDGVGYTADYSVDRSNLAFRESVLRETDVSRIAAEGSSSAEGILKQMDAARIITSGKCSLVQVKRAF